MEQDPETQHQSVYPQQHQQSFPYYYPLPPPREDKRRLRILIVIIVLILIVVPVILSFLLYWIITDQRRDPPQRVVGMWGYILVLNSTSVMVDFGTIRPEPWPVDLEIILTRNATYEGRYTFAHNYDGQLTFSSGFHVGILSYDDLEDNGKVDYGDRIIMTRLAPMSEFVLRMIWRRTGDLIDVTSFATPG